MSEENEVEIVKELAKRFPIGCKVAKGNVYNSSIFHYVDFAYVIGYNIYGNERWLLLYNEDFEGHSSIHGALVHNHKKCSMAEIQKKYGRHCWWADSKLVKRVG